MPEPTLTRRGLLQGVAAAASTSVAVAQNDRPNLLWLFWEDIGPHLGCFGNTYATTPSVDKLAERGCVYTNCWAGAPVCAPARTAIISGVCPTSTGAEHMRSMTRMPAGWKMFPGYLREAGYYCVNNGKEDYNLEKPEGTWDVSWQGGGGAPLDPRNGHWRNRKAGQSFLAVFNEMATHESQIWQSATNRNLVHDPQKASLAAFQPDTPEMRRDWAQYHDQLNLVDRRHQARLDELQQDGLLDSTIIVVSSDHGCGLARYKRMPYDSGLHVPLLVVFPEKFKHLAPKDYRPGGRSDRLIGTIDLAPTMLSLAGIQPPPFYDGRSFAGRYEAPPRDFLHGMRGRMDERHDLIRCTRDKRHVYIRNYNPHKIYGQHVDYAWRLPSTPVWERLYREGRLKAPQTNFWETKPPEELYDLQTDPSEVRNIAQATEHQATLERFRREHHRYELAVRDLGLLPEGEIHRRAAGSAPYEMGHDPQQFPVERILAAADLASSLRTGVTKQLESAIQDPDSAVRYWGAMGVLMRGADEVHQFSERLRTSLRDESTHVRIAAAEGLGKYGWGDDLKSAMVCLVELADCEKSNSYVAIHALNAIDAIGKRAGPWKDQITSLAVADSKSPARVNREYTARLQEWLKRSL